MSPSDLQHRRAHLDHARSVVRAGARWTAATVILISIVGIGSVWILELAGVTGPTEGVLAGVLLVIWMVSGAGLLLTLLLIGLAAVTSGCLQVLEQAMKNQHLEARGHLDV